MQCTVVQRSTAFAAASAAPFQAQVGSPWTGLSRCRSVSIHTARQTGGAWRPFRRCEHGHGNGEPIAMMTSLLSDRVPFRAVGRVTGPSLLRGAPSDSARNRSGSSTQCVHVVSISSAPLRRLWGLCGTCGSGVRWERQLLADGSETERVFCPQDLFRRGKRIGKMAIQILFGAPPVVTQMAAGVLSETGLSGRRHTKSNASNPSESIGTLKVSIQSTGPFH